MFLSFVASVPAGPAPPSTGNDVVDALIYAAHRVRYAADARLRERGISFPSYKLMRALENSDRSMREISEILHNSPRTVTDMIDGLQARGLVDRQPHPSDRRVTLVRLTPVGRSEPADHSPARGVPGRISQPGLLSADGARQPDELGIAATGPEDADSDLLAAREMPNRDHQLRPAAEAAPAS